MTPFEVYKTYLALKNHFTKDSYDYFKYGGKVSASVKSFESRRDRFYFEKLAKMRDPTSFILANLSEDTNIWVGDLCANETAERRYKSWLKRNQSLSYTFRNDLSSRMNTSIPTSYQMPESILISYNSSSGKSKSRDTHHSSPHDEVLWALE
jgi:hypothetical protein